MIVIGELINATRKKVREAVLNRDGDYIKALAEKQAAAGADFIDVNVGVGGGDSEEESECMKWAVELVQEACDLPLCIDSADAAVLRAGLEACREGKTHFVNSVTAETKRLEPTLAVVKEFETRVVALTMGDEGIRTETADRVECARRIMEGVRKAGIPEDRVFFDPLVMPLSMDPRNPVLTLETGRKIKEEFPSSALVMGLSNVSHGLPRRKLLNRVFLAFAVQAGFDAAIIDPTDREMIDTLYAAEALAGKDEFCMNYIRYCKDSG